MVGIQQFKPEEDGSRRVSIQLENGRKIDFFTDFNFKRGLIIPSREEIIAFSDRDSFDSDFLAKCYGYEGIQKYLIPFPLVNWDSEDPGSMYAWSVLNGNQLQIFFTVCKVGFRDYWFEFDLNSKKYVREGDWIK